MNTKKSPEQKRKKQIPLSPKQGKGASLVEMGLLLGLIAVSTIGAVYATGEKTEEIFCQAADGVAEGMNRPGYDCEIPVAEGVTPELPQPPGFTNGNFEDMHYNVGTSGVRRVLMPFESSETGPFVFRTDVNSSNSYSDGLISACVIDGAGDRTCTDRGSSSSIGVPEGATHIGYEMTLPEESWVPWTNEVRLRLYTSETLTWDITVDREQSAPTFNPTFSFSDDIYAKGTTGKQLVLVEKTGDFDGPLRYHLTDPDGGRVGGIQLCIQSTPEADPYCYNSIYSQVNIEADTYAIGYQHTLPGDHYVTYHKDMKAQLTSNIWSDHLAEWDFIISRTPEPIAVQPSFTMTDKQYPEGTTGYQTVMFPMNGTFKGDMHLSYRLTQNDTRGFGLCLQATAESTPNCDVRTYSWGAVSVPEDTYAIGYIVRLKDDTFLDQLAAADITLKSVYDAEEKAEWSFNVTRPGVPLVFEPSFTFEKTNYAKGTTGVQYIKTEMTGNFNDEMTLSSSKRGGIDGGGTADMCFWETASSGPTCGTYYVRVPPTAHSIGIKIKLSTNTAKHVTGSVPVQFYPKHSIGDKVIYRIEAERLPQ